MRRSVLLAAALAVACGGGGPTASTPPPGPSIALRIHVSSVSPIPGGSTSDDSIRLAAAWDLVFEETAGAPATVTFLGATIRDATSGALVGRLEMDSTGVASSSGSARVPARGSLTVSEKLQYSLLSNARAATLSIAAQLQDDQQRFVTATTQTPLG